MPLDRYTLDDVMRIAEMKNRAVVQTRNRLPELRRYFFSEVAPEFEPFHLLPVATAAT